MFPLPGAPEESRVARRAVCHAAKKLKMSNAHAKALAASLAAHSVLLTAATCWSGFTMFPGLAANPKLALTAHYKGFLHAFLISSVAAACTCGAPVFPGLTAMKAKLAFYMLAGGCWVSFVADHVASFINVAMPLGAEKTGAVADDSHPNSMLIAMSAVAGIGLGMIVLLSAMDWSKLALGGKGKAN